jgi:SAM-dependent methyltransferase
MHNRPQHIPAAELTAAHDIQAWEARLNREWPERMEVAQHLAAQIAPRLGPSSLIIELASGAGFLGAVVLRALPAMRYIGFDSAPALVAYAAARLQALNVEQGGHAALGFRVADLAAPEWAMQLQERSEQPRAVVSLQSIHDLGDEAAQAAVYRRVRSVLAAGGMFAFADLLLEPDKPHPRRLPAERHIELLRAAGFTDVRCTWQRGPFGCFVAVG